MKASFEEIKIPVDNEFILCKLFKPKVNDRLIAVVIIHGWSSSDKKYIPLAYTLSSKGYVILTVNLRGHNDSPFSLHSLSRLDHEKDITSAVNFIKTRYPDNTICLLGKSYGGYLSAVVANNLNVDYLILSQPALYPDEDYNKPTFQLIEENPNIFKQYKKNKANNKAIREFAKFKNPILFLESEYDEEIPKSTTENYLQFITENVNTALIENSDHALTKEEWRNNFYSLVINWLEKVIIK